MLVMEHCTTSFFIRLFGKLLDCGQSPQLDQGLLFGVQPPGYKSAIMVMPKSDTDRYRTKAHDNTSGTVIYTDAIMLTEPKQSVAFATSDCGGTVLFAPDTGAVVLMHTGRNQLMDVTKPTTRTTIVAAGLRALTDDGADIRGIRAIMLSQIAAEDFPHQGHEDEAAVCAQHSVWGEAVVSDTARMTLDLQALIKAQLIYYGVQDIPTHITAYRINPYRSPDLYSKRAEKRGSNAITLSRN